MNVGIIGMGKMGMLHAATLGCLDGVKVVAAADKSRFILSAFKRFRKDMRYYTSYEKMLEKESLDFVVISTPSFLHAQAAISAAEKGCHVFLEKPMTATYEQAEQVDKALDKNNVKCMIGFYLRYVPQFAKAKAILESGDLGVIKAVKAEIYIADVFGEAPGWRYQKAISGGGVVIDFAVHCLDMLYWYFGPAKSISAQLRSPYSKEVEDEAEADIEFASGVSAHMSASWSKKEYRKTYLKLYIEGEHKSMTVGEHSLIVESPEGREEFFLPDLFHGSFVDIGGGNMYSDEILEFVSAIREDREPAISAKDGLEVMRMVNMIYASAESGQTVFRSQGARI